MRYGKRNENGVNKEPPAVACCPWCRSTMLVVEARHSGNAVCANCGYVYRVKKK